MNAAKGIILLKAPLLAILIGLMGHAIGAADDAEGAEGKSSLTSQAQPAEQPDDKKTATPTDGRVSAGDGVDSARSEGMRELILDEADEAFIKDTVEIFHNLREAQAKPNVLTPAVRFGFLRDLVKSLNPKADLVAAKAETPGQTEPKSVETAPSRVFPAKIIASQRVFYVRLDQLNQGSCDKLAEDSTAALRLADKPLGIVLDLRRCDAGDDQSLLHALSVLATPEKLPKSFTAKELPGLRLPIITLVGQETKGFGELLAASLKNFGESLVVGKATDGFPPSMKEVALFTGDHLQIPSYPAWVEECCKKTVKPDIEAESSPMIDFDKLSETVGAEKDDPCLAKAVDLLSCLDTIRNKRNYFDEHSPDE